MNEKVAGDHVEGLRVMLAGDYPTLSVREGGGAVVIEGVLQIKGDDLCVETFLVEIVTSDAPGEELPKVYEVGGRIPHNEAHHVNGDGSLCLGVPEQLWIEMAGRVEIRTFIEGPLRSFLLGASEKLRTGKWPYDERSHGGKGVCEFYGEYVGTAEPGRVLDLLRVLEMEGVEAWRRCPCGSGKQLRRCHARQVAALRSKNFPSPIIARSIELVKEALLIEQSGGDEKFRQLIRASRDRVIEAAVKRAMRSED